MRILALALATIVGCAPVTGSSPTLPLTATPTPTAPATTTADASATATVPTRTSVAATPSQPASQRPSPSIVISGDVVSSSASRVAADPNAAKRAATGIQALALDLYRELAVERTNLAFSPYSAASALAMTRVGAAGRTAQEMDQVLHAAQIGDVDAAFNALDLALASVRGRIRALAVRASTWRRRTASGRSVTSTSRTHSSTACPRTTARASVSSTSSTPGTPRAVRSTSGSPTAPRRASPSW